MASSDFLTAWYRSGVKLVGLMLPAPPWMISRGLMVGADWRCLDSILTVFLSLSVCSRGVETGGTHLRTLSVLGAGAAGCMTQVTLVGGPTRTRLSCTILVLSAKPWAVLGIGRPNATPPRPFGPEFRDGTDFRLFTMTLLRPILGHGVSSVYLFSLSFFFGGGGGWHSCRAFCW